VVVLSVPIDMTSFGHMIGADNYVVCSCTHVGQ